MRAAFFFEDRLINGESDFHLSGWPAAIGQLAFASQGLEPYALISGMPNLLPENTRVNFGTAEKPDVRDVTRVLFEIPDLPGDDLLLIFAGTKTAELAAVTDGLYTEAETCYYSTICGFFGAMVHTFQTEAPEQIEFQTITRMTPQGERSDTLAVAVLKNAVIGKSEQIYMPSEVLVRHAIEHDLPLPPSFDLEAYEGELAEYKATLAAETPAETTPVVH